MAVYLTFLTNIFERLRRPVDLGRDNQTGSSAADARTRDLNHPHRFGASQGNCCLARYGSHSRGWRLPQVAPRFRYINSTPVEFIFLGQSPPTSYSLSQAIPKQGSARCCSSRSKVELERMEALNAFQSAARDGSVRYLDLTITKKTQCRTNSALGSRTAPLRMQGSEA